MRSTYKHKQAGWSLPITWILLILITSLGYFFGWITLLYVAGLVILITLSTYIHDLFYKPYSELTFWFSADQALKDIAQKLFKAFNLGGITSGHENTWEWIDADSKYYSFNISKRHGLNETDSLIHLSIMSDTMDLKNDEQDIIGQKLADVLGTDITCGLIRTGKGNRFTYKAQKVYRT